MKTRDTNIEIKREEFPNFADLIMGQMNYGGKKYAALDGKPTREATDYITDVFPEFMESTVMKYLLRWRTQKREEDLIKIATYCFLLWVKYFTGPVAEENRQSSAKARQR